LCVKWYYAVGDHPFGPVTRAELEFLFENGTITTSTLVTQEGMYDWIHFVDLKKTTQFLPAIGKKAEAKEKPETETTPVPEAAAKEKGS